MKRVVRIPRSRCVGDDGGVAGWTEGWLLLEATVIREWNLLHSIADSSDLIALDRLRFSTLPNMIPSVSLFDDQCSAPIPIERTKEAATSAEESELLAPLIANTLQSSHRTAKQTMEQWESIKEVESKNHLLMKQCFSLARNWSQNRSLFLLLIHLAVTLHQEVRHSRIRIVANCHAGVSFHRRIATY